MAKLISQYLLSKNNQTFYILITNFGTVVSNRLHSVECKMSVHNMTTENFSWYIPCEDVWHEHWSL